MKRNEREQFITGSIFLLSNRISQTGDRLLKEITFKQFMLLITIRNMDTIEKNLSTVSEFMGSSRQNIKKMTSILTEKGYLKTSQSLKDARSLNIELTDKAVEFLKSNEMTADINSRLLFENFSDEETSTLLFLISKLLKTTEKISGGKR